MATVDVLRGGGPSPLFRNGVGLNEIQLLLRGQSVVDWHRLAFTTEDEVRGLLALNCINIDDPQDRARLQELRIQAALGARAKPEGC